MVGQRGRRVQGLAGERRRSRAKPVLRALQDRTHDTQAAKEGKTRVSARKAWRLTSLSFAGLSSSLSPYLNLFRLRHQQHHQHQPPPSSYHRQRHLHHPRHPRNTDLVSTGNRHKGSTIDCINRHHGRDGGTAADALSSHRPATVLRCRCRHGLLSQPRAEHVSVALGLAFDLG